MKIELNERQTKTTKTGEVTFDLLLKYLLCLISTFTKTLVYVHPKSRRQLMDDIEYPGLKDTMLPALDQMKDVWIAPPDTSKLSGLYAELGPAVPAGYKQE